MGGREGGRRRKGRMEKEEREREGWNFEEGLKDTVTVASQVRPRTKEFCIYP